MDSTTKYSDLTEFKLRMRRAAMAAVNEIYREECKVLRAKAPNCSTEHLAVELEKTIGFIIDYIE